MAQERGAEILAPTSLETQFDRRQALKDNILAKAKQANIVFLNSEK